MYNLTFKLASFLEVHLLFSKGEKISFSFHDSVYLLFCHENPADNYFYFYYGLTSESYNSRQDYDYFVQVFDVRITTNSSSWELQLYMFELFESLYLPLLCPIRLRVALAK